MRKILYIDNINGSDNNDGLTTIKPLKTLAKAASFVASGGIVELILLTNYAFEKMKMVLFFTVVMWWFVAITLTCL